MPSLRLEGGEADGERSASRTALSNQAEIEVTARTATTSVHVR